jgi:hypothetical protein
MNRTKWVERTIAQILAKRFAPPLVCPAAPPEAPPFLFGAA